ncbi:hypothetical protein SADUNF_Sadunf17G0019700 [Salix dunnii]|uniref:Uncharacterized protein n=1 Tax=Salix dunnii TaxID=1413687 RepID=A0A835MGY8_9ROSI|nr:hypothetical protein SADUNF_Sadunf17G0019700 [Salix dunnii]
MQGQPLLDDELSWMDSLIGGEISLADENVAPGMPMPDALKTGSGTEPADQPFKMDMNNIPFSLMRDVEFRSGTEKMTWELMQSVAERGSSSKRPVDRSVPSSSNNEATNVEQEEQPLLDDGLGLMDILIGGETELVEEPRAPVVLMTAEPETRQRAEQAHQIWHCATAEAGSIFMALNADQKALALTLQNSCIFSCKLQNVIWILSSQG